MAKDVFWLVGDWQRREFAEVGLWLSERGACRRFSEIATALASRRRPQAKDRSLTVVFAQARNGEVSLADLARLRDAMPEARLIVLDGPWCEGEHRGVRFVPGVMRVPWRRWRAGMEAAVARAAPMIMGGNGQDTKAIAAAELEEGLRCLGQRACGTRAVVWASSRWSFSYLADALERLGLQAEWLGGSGRYAGAADVIVYDGWEYVLPIPAQRVRRAQSGTPPRAFPTRILLLNFPRTDDTSAATALGIDAVLPQPVRLSDLAKAVTGAKC
jgi:hypothetical protein